MIFQYKTKRILYKQIYYNSFFQNQKDIFLQQIEIKKKVFLYIIILFDLLLLILAYRIT